ncbi:transposase [Oscillochloris trichoides DG-6]|uniref:Transposase n=1 Tax=Oscillochloris trichoides DG-6 TaxID=765420 RepID=E1ID57_9CHLR|nr:RNA-guided endonuclease TnpB family protein [Oscillochloris trichoides]EFO80889.1 transposase [Oscillochloris trichoides DG-6]
MIRAHTIRLNPTPEQANLFRQAAGTARFCYNWGLRAIKDALDQGMPVPTHRALRDTFKRIRAVAYPWTFQVGKSAIDGAFVNLGRAVKNFLDSRSGRRKGKKVGFPAFKSRRRGYGSFYVANDRFSVDGHTLKAQKIGTVNMTEPLRFVGKILGATIRYQAGWWRISIQVEVAHTPPTHTGPAIGVDLGITSLAVTSEGAVFENQKHLKRALATVKRLQRSVSRKVKGSANRRKAVVKLAKAHFRVACQRKDGLHKLTTALVRHASLVGIEDLNVAGMLRNHRLAQAIADGAWAELRRQLEYKAPAFGSRVIAIGRFVASSKTCNHCGHVNDDLTLAMREWACSNPDCRLLLDRDLNAARNIRDEALRLASA